MKSNLFILMFLLIIQSCMKKDERHGVGEMDSDFKIGDWKYIGLKNENININWKIYKGDSISTSLPSNWYPQKVDDALLYIPNSSKDKNLYYTILKHNMSALNIGIKDYILETFKQISKNTIEIKYFIRKAKLEDNFCYLIEVYSVENGTKYKTNILLYEKNNSLFDIGYKYKDESKNNYKNHLIFNEILTTLKFQSEFLIDTKKNIYEDSGVISINEVN